MVGFNSIVSKLVLPTLTPHVAIFGFLDSTNNDYNFKKNKLLINHILLIFKFYGYRSREKQFIHMTNLIAEIKSAKALDECVQNMSLNIGTSKLHVKNPSEKCDGLGGKSLRTFYAVVVFVVVFVLCFRFLTLTLLSF